MASGTLAYGYLPPLRRGMTCALPPSDFTAKTMVQGHILLVFRRKDPHIDLGNVYRTVACQPTWTVPPQHRECWTVTC